MYMNPNPAAGFAFLLGLGGIVFVVAFVIRGNYTVALVAAVVFALVVWPFAKAAVEQERWRKQLRQNKNPD